MIANGFGRREALAASAMIPAIHVAEVVGSTWVEGYAMGQAGVFVDRSSSFKVGRATVPGSFGAMVPLLSVGRIKNSGRIVRDA